MSGKIIKHKFKRNKNERAIFISNDDTEDIDLNKIKHGDIICFGKIEENYRGLNCYLINTTKESGKYFEKKLIPGTDDSGYLICPIEITKYIENPILFYSEIKDTYEFNYLTLIELDETLHASIIESNKDSIDVEYECEKENTVYYFTESY